VCGTLCIDQKMQTPMRRKGTGYCMVQSEAKTSEAEPSSVRNHTLQNSPQHTGSGRFMLMMFLHSQKEGVKCGFERKRRL